MLKEIRGCLEAELLVDVQQRLVLLSRDVENQNGHRLLINRLSQAVDQIEKRRQQNRPWKVVEVRCGFHEDSNAARDRHYAAHPEDRGANIVILRFFDDKEVADEGKDCTAPAGPSCEEP